MMSTPAFRYAAALYRTGCPVERLCETADYLTDSPPLWEALCSPVVEVREKTAVLAACPLLQRMCGCSIFTRCWRRRAGSRCFLTLWRSTSVWKESKRAKDCAVSGVPGTPGDQALGALARRLCEKYGYQSLTFAIELDPAVLGGFVLEIDG